MKYYDNGFIHHHNDYINIQLFNIGKLVLNLDLYKDKVCRGTLQCIESKEFNNKYLHKSYNESFLYDLFSKNKIYFRDKKNKILIKVK